MHFSSNLSGSPGEKVLHVDKLHEHESWNYFVGIIRNCTAIKLVAKAVHVVCPIIALLA